MKQRGPMFAPFRAAVPQAGFSLVELMIGLALGALITISAVQLFSANQRTFALQRALTEIQEQGRFTLDFIARDLRRVGFTRPAIGGEAGVILDPVDLLGVNIQGSVDNGGNPEVSDQLRISYHGDQDCEGDTAAVEQLVVNSYVVSADGDLVCTGSLPPAASALPVEDVNDPANGTVLISGVESFQVLYGIDPIVNGVPNVARYVPANQVAGEPVLSIRIGILLRSGDATLGQIAADIRDFTVLDQELAGNNPPLVEQGIRRLFVTTVRVRNFDPDTI
ncbi:MAG: PilW family protein [Alcanivoracaceae bacterium]|jgi:type IV pilus assembly protein PilW|nr:PilW family protein [Alcanivoracaceae bacterium]